MDFATKSDDFLEKCQWGLGVIFNIKIYIADLGNFKQGFLAVQDSPITDIVGQLVCPLESTNNQSLGSNKE